MPTILIIVLAGLMATAAMSIVMNIITRAGMANADMIRAIGSIVTRQLEGAYFVGVVLHFFVGAVISIFYVGFISLIDPTSLIGSMGAGAMIGLFHGIAFGFILVAAVAEHHPIEQFREAGLEVALAHLAGHVIYGLVIGIVAFEFGIRVFF